MPVLNVLMKFLLFCCIFDFLLYLDYQSATRLGSPAGLHTSMMKLGSSSAMNRSMTAINYKNYNSPMNRVSSGGVTVMTSLSSPQKGIRFVENIRIEKSYFK